MTDIQLKGYYANQQVLLWNLTSLLYVFFKRWTALLHCALVYKVKLGERQKGRRRRVPKGICRLGILRKLWKWSDILVGFNVGYKNNKKNFKRIWTIIRRKRATDSTQNQFNRPTKEISQQNPEQWCQEAQASLSQAKVLSNAIAQQNPKQWSQAIAKANQSKA